MPKASATPLPERAFKLQKSALFMQQWKNYAENYKERAGLLHAERFITAVEEALNFIGQNPQACPAYDAGEGYEDLQKHNFRKWNLRGFPHLVLFRCDNQAAIFVEVVYAHKMNVAGRLRTDR